MKAFFEKVKNWIIAHKYTTIAIVVVGLIMLYLLSRGSSSNASTGSGASSNPGGVSDAVYAAQLAANAQIATATLGAQAQQQAAASSAAINSQYITEQGQVAEDTLNSNQAIALQTLQAQTAQNTNNNSTAVSLATLSAGVSNNQTDANKAVSLANLDTQLKTTTATIGGLVQLTGLNDSATIAQLQTVTNANTEQALISAAANGITASIGANYKFESEGELDNLISVLGGVTNPANSNSVPTVIDPKTGHPVSGPAVGQIAPPSIAQYTALVATQAARVA